MALEQKDSGLWYDPKFNGLGFSIYVAEGGRIFALFYCGEVDPFFRQPMWLSIQSPQDRAPLPLYLTQDIEFGSPKERVEIATVGSVLFNKKSDDLIEAEVVISGNGKPQFSPAPAPKKETFNLIRIQG